MHSNDNNTRNTKYSHWENIQHDDWSWDGNKLLNGGGEVVCTADGDYRRILRLVPQMLFLTLEAGNTLELMAMDNITSPPDEGVLRLIRNINLLVEALSLENEGVE